MKKFMLLSVGFKQPTPEIAMAWQTWFETLSGRLVDGGSPFGRGREITHNGTKELPLGLDSITGYCIINAQDMAEATKIAESCPIITAIRVYEAASM
ncbi:MAG: hypothetical protein KDE51_01240 [Anaerolineales bacterium]|nr:hypothetical protein [Anaerolineales bacterium]